MLPSIQQQHKHQPHLPQSTQREESEEHKPRVLQEKEITSLCGKQQQISLLSAPCSASARQGLGHPCPSSSHIKCTKASFSSTTVFWYKGCSGKLLFCSFGAPLLPPACLACGVLQLVYFHFKTSPLSAAIFHNLTTSSLTFSLAFFPTR